MAAERSIKESEVRGMVEAILNQQVLPEIATLKNEVKTIGENLVRFIGDGNGRGTGIYGRDQAEKHQQLTSLVADVKKLMTDKSNRDAIAVELKGRSARIYVILGLIFSGVAIAVTLLAIILAKNHGQNAGLQTSTPTTVSQSTTADSR